MTHDPTADGDATRVELYCRPTTAAAAPLTRHHRRLTRLADAGAVATVSVETWPGRVTLLDGTDVADLPAERREPVERRRRFGVWADGAGVALGPAFGRREFDPACTDECRVAYRFPVVALAVHEGDDLVAVYPHRDDGPVSVDAGVDRLARAVDAPAVAAVDGPERTGADPSPGARSVPAEE